MQLSNRVLKGVRTSEITKPAAQSRVYSFTLETQKTGKWDFIEHIQPETEPQTKEERFRSEQRRDVHVVQIHIKGWLWVSLRFQIETFHKHRPSIKTKYDESLHTQINWFSLNTKKIVQSLVGGRWEVRSVCDLWNGGWALQTDAVHMSSSLSTASLLSLLLW